MKTILPAVLFAAFATTSAWAAESVQPLEKIAPYPQAEKGINRFSGHKGSLASERYLYLRLS